MSANAPYHSRYFGAPRSAAVSIKSKSSTRFSAAMMTTTTLKPMPRGPAEWINGIGNPNIPPIIEMR